MVPPNKTSKNIMAASNSVANLNKGLKRTYRVQDVREETELKMRSYANWGEFLVPGPLSIAILGELVFISANTDFAINRFTPDKKYTYIKHPESFRACLMQVCKNGLEAFNTAHRNMDEIRLLSLAIPNDVRLEVLTLVEEDQAIIMTLLPVQLKTKRVSSKCLDLAKYVEGDFQRLIDLISELLENCTSAKSAHQEALKEVKQAIEFAELRKKSAEEAKQAAEKHHTMVNKELEESCEAYREAVKSMPTGGDMIVLALADATISVVTALPDLLKKPSHASQGHQPNPGSQSPESNQMATMSIAAKANMVLTLSQSFLVFLSEDGKIDMSKLRGKKTNKPLATGIGKNFKNTADSIKNEQDCDIKKTALDLCKKGEDICKMLENPGKYPQKKTGEAIVKLVKRAEEFKVCCNNITATSAFQPRPPNASKAMGESCGSESSGSLLRSTVQMSQMKIEQSKQQLRDSRDEYHKSFENMKKCTQEFDSIFSEMGKLNMEEIDFGTTIKTLAKGLEALGRVREQWTKMVQFFQMISNLIETCLNQNITDFVSQCEAVPAIPNYRHLDYIKDMLYGPAFQASNIAHLVHMISETYVQVSSQYLMDRVSNLGTLMTLEPNNPEFKRAREKLQGSCEEAQKGILELVQKNRDDFDEKIEKRIDTINQNLKAALPAPSREEQKAIEDTVRKDPKLLLKEISASFAEVSRDDQAG